MTLRQLETRLGFAGHQTFSFRHGWLKKAVDAVRQDSLALSRDDAIVTLGVGKNMVESIRHWGLATKMLTDASARGLAVSRLGALLLGEWDPFLEDPASLWLLHWLLVSNTGKAGVWHITFGFYPQPFFTKAGLNEFVSRFAESRGARPRPSTLERDVDCLVRTYVPSAPGDGSVLEETFDCPLTELSLLSALDDYESFRFVVGPKRSLPAAIFGYALLQYAGSRAAPDHTLSVGECTYFPGSPGQVFKLDENSVIEYVEALAIVTQGAVQFDETAGLRQIYVQGDPEPEALLAGYFSGGAAL